MILCQSVCGAVTVCFCSPVSLMELDAGISTPLSAPSYMPSSAEVYSDESNRDASPKGSSSDSGSGSAEQCDA